MAHGETAIRTTRGIQQSLLLPPRPAAVVTPTEAKGVVYTKRWVVETVLDLAGYRSERNLVDALAVEPAAGDGAFLGPMVERLLDSCKRLKRPLSDCRSSLIGYEVDDESAQRTRALAASILTSRGAERGVADELADSWVQSGDYLLEATAHLADFVIGNPPYIRLEDIPDETAALYRQVYRTMRGRADLYIAFFEAALHQLRPGGVCGFICADRWMRNQYGGELRELVTSGYAVEAVIEMHHADAFEDEVDAYPAITVIRRGPQGPVVIATAKAEVEHAPSQVLSDTLRGFANGECPKPVKGLRVATVHAWFEGSAPWPIHSPDQLALLRRIEKHFPTLEAYARVGIGVATGNDSVFITKQPDLVERSRLLKLAMAGDISEGVLNWSGHYLVDPWESDGLAKLESYPKLGAYFNENGEALKKRHTAVKNSRTWYRTIDRVTHTLTAKPKLYIADIKDSLNPVLDQGETYPHHNLYFVESDVWDLEVLGGLLMSAVGEFFVKSYGVRMRGGYLRFQAQYLRRICVPPPTALSKLQSNQLKQAFRTRDRRIATETALEIYEIDRHTMETAFES